MNAKGNVSKWLNKDIRSRLCNFRYSHNVTMLSNGEVIFVDIGSSDRNMKDKDMVTAEMDQYLYSSNGKDKYSSAVDFIDGSGAVTMTYHNDFPLIFGDYNHDGHPDYTIRISSDEWGSTYDVRCIDVGGTPWEDSGRIYIYDEFSESVRLQVSDTGKILNLYYDDEDGSKYKEINLLKDLSNTVHDSVTNDEFVDYRMYSQKFYFPENLRVYDQSDKKIICYFWNNTVSKVLVGGEYEIERKNRDSWEISLYRIKTNAGSKIVYGGFYKENSSN